MRGDPLIMTRRAAHAIHVAARDLFQADIEFVGTWSKGQPRGTYELLAVQLGKLVSIRIETQPSFRITQTVETGLDPVALGLISASGLSADRWMIVKAPDTELGAADLRLVLNWTAGLKKHLQEKKAS